MRLRFITSAGALALLNGCASAIVAPPLESVTVRPFAETQAVASKKDAADDPAIWVNHARRSESLIVATDKKAGLNVYSLSGTLRSSLAAGRLNNVDLRDRVRINRKPQILVAASDRSLPGEGRLALFTLDPKTAMLSPLAQIAAGVAESYGACLFRAKDGAVHAFIVGKDGSVVQIKLDLSGAEARGVAVRRFKLETQSEGCVADDRTGDLYIGEETKGVWRFSADETRGTVGTLVAPVDGKRLVADTEGVAIAAEGRRGGYLIVSSQGDSHYTLYRLPQFDYAGRFAIRGNGKGIGGTSETDGIEVTTMSLGRDYGGGLMIAQDGDNAPLTQNFKLVRWRDVKKALRLK